MASSSAFILFRYDDTVPTSYSTISTILPSILRIALSFPWTQLMAVNRRAPYKLLKSVGVRHVNRSRSTGIVQLGIQNGKYSMRGQGKMHMKTLSSLVLRMNDGANLT